MISDFLASWPLFYKTYLAGFGIAALLSLVGVLVVIRKQIFLGAAVSQASTLGVALALLVGIESDAVAAASAVGFSVAAALLTSRVGRESSEARTGWVFLISASFSILVLAHSPHGLEEIHRLLASSLIGASGVDVVVFGLLSACAAAGIATGARRILLFATDPPMAAAVGMRVGAWSACTAIALGVSVGLSIRASGLLFTFGCLVLPGLIAKAVCRELHQMFVVSPIVAVATALVGFVLANSWDDPPAQMAVALLSLVLGAVWLAARLVGPGRISIPTRR